MHSSAGKCELYSNSEAEHLIVFGVLVRKIISQLQSNRTKALNACDIDLQEILRKYENHSWMNKFGHNQSGEMREPVVRWNDCTDYAHPMWPTGALMTEIQYQMCKGMCGKQTEIEWACGFFMELLIVFIGITFGRIYTHLRRQINNQIVHVMLVVQNIKLQFSESGTLLERLKTMNGHLVC